MSGRRARWIAVAFVLIAATAAQALGLVEALRYERAGIADGEVWRVVTAHLVHLSPLHLLLNAAGLILVTALVGMHLQLTGWALSFGISAVAVSAGLWLAVPDLRWYVGLSGVLHGLIVSGALAAVGHRRELPFALTLLAVVTGKLIWEQAVGAMPATGHMAGGPVIIDAHLFGAFGGAIAAATVLGWSWLRPGTTSAPGS